MRRFAIFLIVLALSAPSVLSADLGYHAPPRPNFGPYQIQSKEELRPGMLIQMCHTGEVVLCYPPVEIFSNPYPVFNGGQPEWRIIVLQKVTYGTVVKEISLDFWGVTPYPDKSWDASNWLKRVFSFPAQ